MQMPPWGFSTITSPWSVPLGPPIGDHLNQEVQNTYPLPIQLLKTHKICVWPLNGFLSSTSTQFLTTYPSLAPPMPPTPPLHKPISWNISCTLCLGIGNSTTDPTDTHKKSFNKEVLTKYLQVFSKNSWICFGVLGCIYYVWFVPLNAGIITKTNLKI